MTHETMTPETKAAAARHPSTASSDHDNRTAFARSAVGRVAPWLVLPVLLSCSLWATWFGFTRFDLPPLVAALPSALVFGVLAVGLLEWALPYRQAWRHAQKGDARLDFLHILVNQGLVEKLMSAVFATVFAGGSGWVAQQLGFSPWPHQWPLLAQVLLMTVIADFGAYWYHRLAHQTAWIWRFHAVHHSSHRLYYLNVPKTHPIESCMLSIPVTVPFILLGTNAETIALYFTGTVVLGLLQHCNIDMRLGILKYVFSVGELHRWHHSKLIEESDNNFGNNLILWDLVFGTFFHPEDREVGELGLLNPDYPQGYLAQLAAPFANRDISKPVGYQEP